MRYFLFLPIFAFANPTGLIVGVTQTQAILQIKGAQASVGCSIGLATNLAFFPEHPDVNGSEYSGAGVDLTRADTIVQSDGTRLVTLGHMNDDRALAAATQYFWEFSSCGGGVTIGGSFITAPLANGSVSPGVPFNSSAYGNRAWPATSVNIAAGSALVDPISGVQWFPVCSPTCMTWRTGANGSATPPSGFYGFAHTVGGSTWSNSGNVINGLGSNASSTDTTTLDLYPDPTHENTGTGGSSVYANSGLNDISVVVYEGGTDASSANRTAQWCVFKHQASGCVGTPFTVAGPQSAIAHVLSGSSDPDQPYPSAFPSAFFTGWGANVFIGRHLRATSGTLACVPGSPSTCTIDTLSEQSHFDPGMIAGDKVYIAGSSCTNSMCTLSAAPSSAGVVTISESVTASSGTSFVAYQWGIRVNKTTATGTLTIGANYKLAGSINIGQAGPVGIESSNLPYTTGDGKSCYMSVVENTQNGSEFMVCLATDGTSREMWAGKIPASSYFTGGGCAATGCPWSANDVPNDPCCELQMYNFHHDPTHPNIWYYYGPNEAGNHDLYELTYATGQLSSANSWGYTLPPPYSDNRVLISPSDNWTWKLILTNSTTLPSIIAASSLPQAVTYQSGISIYGTNWSFNGMMGDGKTAVFQNNYAGGQNYAAWIAYLDVTGPTLTNLMHTLDGTGSNGRMRYGGFHTLTLRSDFSSPITTTVINDLLTNANPSSWFGGPFKLPIQYVWKSGAWSSDTSLDWPIGSGVGGTTGSAMACPANPYVFMNATTTGNQCILIRVPSGGSCNTSPGASEISAYPCPTPTGTISGWVPGSYSQPVAIAVGDVFADYTLSPSDPADNENLRIVAAGASDPGYQDWYVQRNAKFDYCCPGTGAPPQSSGCVDVSTEFQHATQWFGIMLSAQLNGCASQTANIQGTTQSGQQFWEVGRTLAASHADLGAGITAGSATWVGAQIATPSDPFSTLWGIPPPDSSFSFPLNAPTFNSTQLPIGNGSVQAYTGLVPGGKVNWFVDANTLNNNSGGNGVENISPIGTRSVTQQGSSTIYLIGALSGDTFSNANYKQYGIKAYAGRFNFIDVSGPSSVTMLASTSYGVCYVYVAGECYSGSTVGQVYANVPTIAFNTNCATGQSWANIICAIMAWPGAGDYRQAQWTSPDNQGVLQRSLGYCFGGPGVAYAYSQLVSISSALTFCGATMQAGWAPIAYFTINTPWQTDSVNRTAFVNVPVNIPAGLSPVDVLFGYSSIIGANAAPSGNLRCTGRAQSCAAGAGVSPFGFVGSDTLTLTSCTSGCTVNVPIRAGNIAYLQIFRSGVGQDIQAIAVP